MITQSNTSLPARAAATASAILLVTASAGFGATYAWTQGQHHSPVLAALAVCMALGLELAKPFAVSGTLAALRSLRLGQAVALALLAAASVLYSLTAELSLIATTRNDAAAQRSTEAGRQIASEGRARRAEVALAALAPSRPSAELRADIAAIDATPGVLIDGAPCGGIANGRVTRDLCPKRSTLAAELARAEERQRLERELAELGATGAAGPDEHTTRAADPGSKALATYLAALGFAVPTAVLADWVVLIGVLALEIGSATAVLLVRSVGQPKQDTVPASVHTETAEPVHADASQAVHVDTAAPATAALDSPRKPSRGRRLGPAAVASKASAEKAIVDALQERGGRLDAGGVRGLAAVIGAKKSTVHNAVVALVACGVLAKAGSEIILRT